MKYNVPPNLLGSLRSDAGQLALGEMFSGRLRDLHQALEVASDTPTLHRLQGQIKEVRDLQKALAK